MKACLPSPPLSSVTAGFNKMTHDTPSPHARHESIIIKSLVHWMFPIRWGGFSGESRLEAWIPDLATPAPMFITQEGTSSAHRSQLGKNSTSAISHKQERGQFPRCRLISITLPPSFLRHGVISPLQYNKYFTFKSRFIKGSPGGRNNKVSLYSPNKTGKDIFYNSYFRL